MTPTQLLQHPSFQVLGLPLCFLFIGVFAKRLGRRDGDDSPKLNDWAVSTTILLMTFSKVAADMQLPNSDIVTPATWMSGILLMIFVSIDHERYRSWKTDSDGKQLKEKRPLAGVVLPNTVSLLIFGSYQYARI